MSSRTLVPLVALALAACAKHSIPPVELINQTRIGPAEDFGPGITAVRSNGITFDLSAPAHVIVLRVTNANGIEPVRPVRSGDRSALKSGRHVATLPGAAALAPSSGRTAAYGVESYAGYLACAPVFESDPTRAPDPVAARDTTGRLARSAVTAQRRYDDCVRRESARETIFQRAGPVALTRSRDDIGYWVLIVSDVPTAAADLNQRLAPMTFPDSSLLAVVQHVPEALVASRTSHWAAYYVPFGVPSTH